MKLFLIWDPKDFTRASHVNKTVSGRTCQNWASNTPHRHWIKNVKGVKGRSGGIIDKFSSSINRALFKSLKINSFYL